jgi:hypothetical protein
LTTIVIVALGGLAAAGRAHGAPPSSAMSNPELAPPKIPVKTKEVTKLYRCTGYYNSFDCTTVLWLNDCKHSISVSWGPLQIPGTLEWARLHRNFCSITYDGVEFKEERKLEPEKCDGLMRLFAAAFQGFPGVQWQDAKCTNISAPDGILYESQHYHAPGHPDFLHNPLPDPDPEPQAARLEDVRQCELHNPTKKKRWVRCPVLVPLVNSWLRKFLAFVDVGLVIQNKMK